MSATLHSIFVFAHTWWVELLCAVLIVLVFPIIAGYVMLVERKVMTSMQARQGAMSVGPHDPMQPIADALKLLIKVDLIPDNADRFLFWLAPIVSMAAALISMGAIAFGPWFQVARDINIGLLFVVGVSALSPLGIILGGWASNNQYTILGALRSTVRLISYETTAGFALVSGFLLAGTLNVRAIVETQRTDQAWYIFLAPVGFFTYLIASIAGTNRSPLDIPEAQSELVAGYRNEYSGFRWSHYFLAEYAAMIVVASVGTTLFLGGWLRPFPNVQWLGWLDAAPTLLFAAVAAYCAFRAAKQPAHVQSFFMWAVALACFVVAAIYALAAPFGRAPLQFMHDGLYGAFWFVLKVSADIYVFVWLRVALPRLGFGQVMRMGWHILIPLALINVVDVGIALALSSEFGLNRWAAMIVTTGVTLVAAIFLLHWNDKYSVAASAALLADSSTVEDPHAG
jgi:NADH-quinone oxidoreductase subunit H